MSQLIFIKINFFFIIIIMKHEYPNYYLNCFARKTIGTGAGTYKDKMGRVNYVIVHVAKYVPHHAYDFQKDHALFY